MTRHNDLEDPQKYLSIKYVEFLDLLSRIAIDYFEILGDEKKDLEDKVHELLKLFWPKSKGADKKTTKKVRGKREKKVQ